MSAIRVSLYILLCVHISGVLFVRNVTMQIRTRPVHDTPVRTPPRSLKIWMGGAGRSGDGLRMVSRVSVGGAGMSGDGLRMVSRVSL